MASLFGGTGLAGVPAPLVKARITVASLLAGEQTGDFGDATMKYARLLFKKSGFDSASITRLNHRFESTRLSFQDIGRVAAG